MISCLTSSAVGAVGWALGTTYVFVALVQIGGFMVWWSFRVGGGDREPRLEEPAPIAADPGHPRP